MRISYSSSNLLQGCERRFWHEKVDKTSHDPDYTDDSTALRLGKAYHEVLELVFHRKAALAKRFFLQAFENNAINTDTERAYIYAMVHRYLTLHGKSGLRAKNVEIRVGNDDYIGYIDAIMVDKNGNWWIVDLKTAARLNGSLLSRLSKDPQLNLYSRFADQVAEVCDLDMDLFAGVRYRVTTKPTIRITKKESFTEFTKRCYERVEAYDIGIPVADLDPEGSYKHIMTLLDRANTLDESPAEVAKQNFTYCESYFRPCPYWSQCYGSTFSDSAKIYSISDSQDISDLTIEDPLLDF